jgi:AcrR family transcriptional regulator
VSANQDHKRAQIIEAARVVLARDGLAGCTARAVAEASPLTKSAIHYYFSDIDEIIDAAVAAHLDAMLATLRDGAGQHTDPHQRLHAVLETYLAIFAEKPHAAFLFFEYWIAAGRRGSSETVEQMLRAVQSLLAEMLGDLAIDDNDHVAHALLSWLLGTVVQQQLHPRPVRALHAEVDNLLSTSRVRARPRTRGRGSCAGTASW